MSPLTHGGLEKVGVVLQEHKLPEVRGHFTQDIQQTDHSQRLLQDLKGNRNRQAGSYSEPLGQDSDTSTRECKKHHNANGGAGVRAGLPHCSYLITGNGASGERQHSAATFLEGAGQEVSHSGGDAAVVRALLVQLRRDQLQKGDSEK